MKQPIALLALATITLFSGSCKKEDIQPEETTENPTNTESPTANLIKLGETYVIGASAKATVYGTKEPVTGYNEIFVSFTDSADGSALNNGHFDLLPMMNMGSMQHSCPVENSEDTIPANGLFRSAVFFSMPGSASQWCFNLIFHNHKTEKFGSGKLALAVKDASPIKFRSTVISADDNSSICISLINPTKAVVGINDFEVVLHKKASTMSYMPVDDYKIEIEPTMPSMGHGSPNNVNPVISSEGHYKGKVNFTMSGLWKIKLKLYKNGVLLSEDQYFEITI